MVAAGEDRVAFGDAVLDDIARAAGLDDPSSYRTWRRILDGLERAPDLFVKGHMLGCDSRGTMRRLRLFTLIASPSPTDPS